MNISNAINWAIKFISALALGLTMALVGQEVFKYGLMAFLFVLVLTMGLVLRVLKSFTIVNVIVFDLVCVLVGLALKMYILMAP